MHKPAIILRNLDALNREMPEKVSIKKNSRFSSLLESGKVYPKS